MQDEAGSDPVAEEDVFEMAMKLPEVWRPNAKEIKRKQKSWTRTAANGARVEINRDKKAHYVFSSSKPGPLPKRNFPWSVGLADATAAAMEASGWEN